MIPRHLLPQIPNDKIAEFQEYLQNHRVESSVRPVPVESIKPIQSHVNTDKIDALAGRPVTIPVILDKDGHLIDGHHRWLAVKQQGKSVVPAVVCDVELLPLLKLAHRFDGSFTKSIHELATYNSRLTSTSPNLHLEQYVDSWLDKTL